MIAISTCQRLTEIEKCSNNERFLGGYFWIFGEKIVPLHRFRNMLVINGYFRFCYMFATLCANALIVKHCRF